MTLTYGKWDCTKEVRKLLTEIEWSSNDMLGTPEPVMVIHGAPLWGPYLRCLNVHIVSPERLLSFVRESRKDRRHRSDLAAHIAWEFKPYVD